MRSVREMWVNRALEEHLILKEDIDLVLLTPNDIMTEYDKLRMILKFHEGPALLQMIESNIALPLLSKEQRESVLKVNFPFLSATNSSIYMRHSRL